MDIAIIVVSIALALGLVALFVTVGIFWRKSYPKPLPNGEPRPKQTLKEWLINHKPSKRRLIQIYAALLYNANIKGFISGEIYTSETTKYMCVPGLNCYSCPGAVGACPLGALQNALSASNTRAPYYILGILGIFGLTFARTVCGFLCPVGLGQDLLYKIRTPKLKKNRVTRVLSYFKYVILAVLVIAVPLIFAAQDVPLPGFCKFICPAGTFGGAIALLIHPNNAGKFAQLGPLFTWKFCVLVAIVVAAIFIYRFFCRFLCPLGAIYGFFNRIALVGVKVDKENCTECGLCISHCKMDVKHVGDHECINCGECISVCPTSAIRWKGSKIFVRGNEAALATPPSEERPLGSMVLATADTDATVTAGGGAFEAKLPENNETYDKQPEKKAKRPKKDAKFWVQLTAWIVALAVLIGALIYYNAVDVKRPYDPPIDAETGYEIGDTAPDFTVKLYGSDGTFNLYEHRGKVTVINFWATWCTPCVAEIPFFNELTVNHSEWNVIAIHGAPANNVDTYIAKNWSDYSLTFAQDNLEGTQCQTFLSLGGTTYWPMTVIVDEEGVVIYNSTVPFHSYGDLETAVQKAIDTDMGYEIGDTAPDFTVKLYGSDGTFNLYEHRGKVTVVNFWATWCTPCVAEIPFFNELTVNHPEWNVVAIHGAPANNVDTYIAKNWSDYSLTFAQDNLEGTQCQTFLSLGGTTYWPMTVIVDEAGVVIYNSTVSFHSYGDLETAVQNAIDSAAE